METIEQKPRDDSVGEQLYRQAMARVRDVINAKYLKPLEAEPVALRAEERGDIRYYYQQDRMLFREKGDSLSTHYSDEQTALRMVEKAGEMGMTRIRAEGSKKFRHNTWLYGTLQGLEVVGYEASETDLLRLESLKRYGNRLTTEREPEPLQVSSRKDPEPKTEAKQTGVSEPENRSVQPRTGGFERAFEELEEPQKHILQRWVGQITGEDSSEQGFGPLLAGIEENAPDKRGAFLARIGVLYRQKKLREHKDHPVLIETRKKLMPQIKHLDREAPEFTRDLRRHLHVFGTRQFARKRAQLEARIPDGVGQAGKALLDRIEGIKDHLAPETLGLLAAFRDQNKTNGKGVGTNNANSKAVRKPDSGFKSPPTQDRLFSAKKVKAQLDRGPGG